VIGNRGFDQATCLGQTPQQRAADAAAQVNKIQTYVLMFTSDTENPDTTTLPFGSNELAVAGGSDHVYDARVSKGPAQDAFQTVVNDLATCVYDVIPPQTRPDAQSTLSYSDPIDPSAKTTTIAAKASSTAISSARPSRTARPRSQPLVTHSPLISEAAHTKAAT